MNFETSLVYSYLPSYYNRISLKERVIFKVLFDDPNNHIVESVRNLESCGLSDHQVHLAIKIADIQDRFLDKLDMKYC